MAGPRTPSARRFAPSAPGLCPAWWPVYKVTFDMPLRLAVGERAMAIAGRLQDILFRLMDDGGPVAVQVVFLSG